MVSKKLKKKIERVMRSNGWMYPDEVADKIKEPFMDVYDAMAELRKDGFVKQQR